MLCATGAIDQRTTEQEPGEGQRPQMLLPGDGVARGRVGHRFGEEGGDRSVQDGVEPQPGRRVELEPAAPHARLLLDPRPQRCRPPLAFQACLRTTGEAGRFRLHRASELLGTHPFGDSGEEPRARGEPRPFVRFEAAHGPTERIDVRRRRAPGGQGRRHIRQRVERTDPLDHPGGLASAGARRPGDHGLGIGAESGELSHRVDLQAVEHAPHPGDGRQGTLELAAARRRARPGKIRLPHQPRQLSQLHGDHGTEGV